MTAEIDKWDSVRCPKCKRRLSPGIFNKTGETALSQCTGCKGEVIAIAFPALRRQRVRVEAGQPILDTSEASCFNHVDKQASQSCARCGRFICTLCEVELNDQYICPQCFETGRQKGAFNALTNERTIYDNIALALALVPIPLFLWAFFFITAPATLFITFRHWKTPLGLTRPRRRWRYIVASLVAVAEIITFITFIFGLFRWGPFKF